MRGLRHPSLPPRGLSRRGFGLLAAAGLLLPRRLAAAAADQASRKFLFVFASGGWDPTWVFAPLFGSEHVDMDPEATTSTVDGLTFVDSGRRPFVRAFFEQYAARTCFVNGFEVRSVTHERCRRLLLTGSSASAADDWPAILAGSVSGYILPHLVISGPSYTSRYGGSVVRVGVSGQLAELVDGSALQRCQEPAMPPSTSTDALVSAYLRGRLDAAALAAGTGRAQQFVADYSRSLDQRDLVQSAAGLDLAVDSSPNVAVSTRVHPAVTCFANGYSRCAIIEHAGQFGTGWDTHTGNDHQSDHYEVLFQDLATILQQLDTTPGPSGGMLSDEVTVVVFSEMGRTPRLNSRGGKDHWTFTSAMLFGAGVRGGQVLGGYDDTMLGLPTDLTTGEPTDAGTLLSSENLGATLLAMADIDPGEVTPAEPLTAAFT
jgi:hypothetical protein